MRLRITLLTLAACIAARPVTAQNLSPELPENAVQKVAPHVHAIVGFPNVLIVVGSKATLVVDTGKIGRAHV